MVKIQYKIFGIREREWMVKETQERLGIPDSDVFYDEKHTGNVYKIARTVWKKDLGDETHRCVLQDDAHVCDNFDEILHQAIEAHPYSIITLFPGMFLHCSKPPVETPYVRTNLVCGVGIVMPKEYIDECFNWCDVNFPGMNYDDYAIQLWAERYNAEVITILPAILQHIGDKSTLSKMRIRRYEHYTDTPIGNWDSTWVIPKEESVIYRK